MTNTQDASQDFLLRRQFTFEAAHFLPNVPKEHKCRRLHGHSFSVELICEGTADRKIGWLVDFADIKAAFEPILTLLDHRFLNEVEGLENPTSEQLARWIWIKIKPELTSLTAVTVAETCNASCTYKG